jgi:hypothetical protein
METESLYLLRGKQLVWKRLAWMGSLSCLRRH